jgi:hypothetical protein
MTQEMTNLLIFIGLCFVGYLIFRYIPFREGMESNNSPMSSTKSGLAGNAASYSDSLKSQAVNYQDTLHIDKYRKDYENAIIHLDDLVDNLMLRAALMVDPSNPITGLEELSKLNGSKLALNNVMKFIDGK